jgi:hypothetical protein
MRIRPNVVPTPIVSPATLQGRMDGQAQPAGATPGGAPPVVMDPVEIDLVGRTIQLQPGELAKLVDQVNETARIFNHSLRFSIGENNRVIVKVVDDENGEILREIPPEHFTDLFNRMENALGLLLNLRL